MQTFLPYPSFVESAKVLDYKRLGKQRVEAKQILETNLCVKIGYIKYCVNCHKYTYDLLVSHICQKCGSSLLTDVSIDSNIPWVNHPAVVMWRGYELALARYGCIMCLEWKERGYKDTLLSYFTDYIKSIETLNSYIRNYHYTVPSWLGYKDENGDINEIGTKFHLSHQSNLVRKNPDHYRQFFPNIQDDLPYIWPV